LALNLPISTGVTREKKKKKGEEMEEAIGDGK
jgi:hypothetical protein